MHIRYEISVGANVVTPTGDARATVTEISLVGLRLQTRRVIFPDTCVKVYFEPDHHLLIEGEVIWVLTDCNARGETSFDAGIRIDTMSLPEVSATGLASRSELMPDILLSFKDSEIHQLENGT